MDLQTLQWDQNIISTHCLDKEIYHTGAKWATELSKHYDTAIKDMLT